MSHINSNNFNLATGLNLDVLFECENIGMLNSNLKQTFSFLEAEKYVAIASKNDNIKVI